MWSAVKIAGQRTYYVNTETNETTWEKPIELYDDTDRALASTPWRQYETDEGRVYWYKESTQQSTWELPIEAPKISLESCIKNALAKSGNCSYSELLPQIVEFDEYWQLEPAERLEMIEKIRKESQKMSKEEIAQQRAAKIEDIRSRATGYISAKTALKLAKGDKSIVVEALNNPSKYNVPLDPSINSSLSTQITELSTGAANWDLVEQKARQKIGYTPNPQIVTVYHKTATDIHKARMDILRAREPVVKRQAARARLEFIEALKTAGVDQKTEWLEVVPQIESQVIRLGTFPGSTPLDMFFWYQEHHAQPRDFGVTMKKALYALKGANKRSNQVTFEEFKSITNINDHEIYRKLREDFYAGAREMTRKRAAFTHPRGGNNPTGDSLEY